MARHVAKEIVASSKARECLVSVAYAIGRAEPVMVQAINEKGNPKTGTPSSPDLGAQIKSFFYSFENPIVLVVLALIVITGIALFILRKKPASPEASSF